MTDKSTHDSPHVLPLKTYLATGAALLVLTGATVGVSFINLGGWNAIVAVGIASVKALLVALIFMHLLYDKKIFLVIFATAIIFLGIFLSLTMFDILSRGDVNPDYKFPVKQTQTVPDSGQIEHSEPAHH